MVSDPFAHITFDDDDTTLQALLVAWQGCPQKIAGIAANVDFSISHFASGISANATRHVDNSTFQLKAKIGAGIAIDSDDSLAIPLADIIQLGRSCFKYNI